MTPLSSTNPSDIANAARCFESCVPGSAQAALRSYLLAQSANIATPPCITPAAPLNLRSSALPAGVDPNTNLRVSWNTPKNSGSLITGYIVSWGTTQGGPYPNSSGVIGAGNHSYTISGLTSGTTYYVVVQSFSFTGCASANSTELSTKTSGGNGLLTGLISYWKFDPPPSLNTAPDSIGTNNLTLDGAAANTGSVGGKINTGLGLGIGGAYAGHVSNPDFNMGAGVSFSFSLWIYASDYTASSPYGIFLSKGDDQHANNQYELLVYQASAPANRLLFFVWGTDNVAYGFYLTPSLPAAGWHHVVIGFDSATKTVFGYFDNGTVVTQNLPVNGIRTGTTDFRLGLWTGALVNALANQTIDELALYNRALSASDVSTLFNGGAALPLSSFTS